jgi:hypothetical protein
LLRLTFQLLRSLVLIHTKIIANRISMAIHPDHPGLTIEVVVDEEPLPEYIDHETSSEGKELTRYIEARSGAEFQIWYRFTTLFPTKKDISFIVDIDGKVVDSGFFQRNTLTSSAEPFVTDGAEVKIGSKWVLQCLSFVNLDVGESIKTI